MRMDDELEWLRNAAPSTNGPGELVRRRARAHLLSAYDAPAPTDATALQPLPLDGEVLDDPAMAVEAEPADTSRRNRIAAVAAAAVLLAMVGATLFGGDDDVEEDAADPVGETVTEEPVATTTTTTARPPAPLVTPRIEPAASALITAGQASALGPAVQLADEDVISILAEGFEKPNLLTVTMCTGSEPTDPRGPGCDVGTLRTQAVGPDGTVELDYRLFRAIEVDGELVDCATAPCVVSAAPLSQPEVAGAVAIEFDPTGEPAAPPRLTVSPAEDHFDGQLLTISGEGFDTSTEFAVYQCLMPAVGGTPDCDHAATGYLTAYSNDVGTITATLRATRYISTAEGFADCTEVPGGCVVLAEVSGGPDQLATMRTSPSARIVFDPDLATSDGGPVVVPTTGLVDGSVVSVVGTAGDARAWSAKPPQLCTEADQCTDLAFTEVDQTVRLTAGEIRVPRRLYADGVTVDCRDTPCELRFVSGGAPAVVALSFDPSAPPLPAPAATVDDPGPYAAGQAIRVGLPEGLRYWVSQCVADIVDDVCEGFGAYGPGAYFEDAFAGDTTGTQTIDLQVFRRIWTQLGPHDCVDDGACELRFFGPFDSPRLTPVPLPFDPSVPVIAGPQVTVRPRAGLADGSSVSVRVDGLAEREWYGISMCPATASAFTWCPPVFEGTSTATGSGSALVRLPRRLTTWDAEETPQTVDCALESCSLRVIEGRLRTDAVLDFDPETPLLPDPTVRLTEPGPHDPTGLIELRGDGFFVTSPDSRPRPVWTVCDREPVSQLDAYERCTTPRDAGTEVGTDGSFVTTIRIGDPSRLRFDNTETPLTCSTCWIRLSTAATHLQVATTPIEFTRS